MAKLLDAIKKEFGPKKKTKKTGLLGAVGEKVFGSKKPARESKVEKVTQQPEQLSDQKEQLSDVSADLSILTKNSMVMAGMSRDFNVIRQNIVKITKAQGQKPALGADAHFLKAGEREEALGVQREKEKEKRTPERLDKKGKPVATKDKGTKTKTTWWASLIKMLADPNVLILAVYGALNLIEFFQGLWDDIVAAWDEWIVGGKLWETIKEKSGEFVDWIKDTFTLENLSKMIGKVGEFLEPLWESVKSFFGEVGKFVSDKFYSVMDFFGIPIKRKEEKPKELEMPKDNGKAQINVDANQAGKTVQKQIDAAVDAKQKETGAGGGRGGQGGPTAEQAKSMYPKYTEEEIKRVEAQEKAAQYTGRDEIVRSRMGLGEVSAAEMRETMEKQKAEKVTKQQPPAGKPEAPTKEVKAPSIGGDDKSIMAMIKKHEGVRTRPYKDSLGLWTVGVGHLIGDGKSLPPEWDREFTMQEIDALFAQDYEHHKKMAEKSPGYDKANEKGRAALIDLAFNMGGGWYKKFKNTAAALAAGDFQKAADELTDSQWYKQVKGRAQTVVALIREGMGQVAPQAVKPPTTQVAAAPTTPKKEEVASGKVPALSAVVTKQNSGVDISSFKSTLEERVAKMAAAFQAETGKKLMVTSGVRSNEKQKELWDAKLAEVGGNEAAARKMVAEPMPPLGKGRGSKHLTGEAIDINSKGDAGINVLAGPRDKPTGWLEKFGLTRNVPGEDWHVQALGSQPTPDNSTNPGQPILVAGKDGKASDVSTGKSQPVPQPPPQKSPTGAMVASASNDVGVQQRRQVADAAQPVIINNTTVTSTTQVINTTKNTVVSCERDSMGRLVTRNA